LNKYKRKYGGRKKGPKRDKRDRMKDGDSVARVELRRIVGEDHGGSVEGFAAAVGAPVPVAQAWFDGRYPREHYQRVGLWRKTGIKPHWWFTAPGVGWEERDSGV